MKISNNNIFYSLEKTFVILFGMILLAGCSSTKQSSPAPAPVPAATTETEEEVYDDPTNIMSGEFARVLAKWRDGSSIPAIRIMSARTVWMIWR